LAFVLVGYSVGGGGGGGTPDDPIVPSDGTQNITGNLTVSGLFSVSDNITEGNFKTLRSNDTNLTTDPTCANLGTTGSGNGDLTYIDTNESSSVEDWVVCQGTNRSGFLVGSHETMSTRLRIPASDLTDPSYLCPALDPRIITTSGFDGTAHDEWCFAPFGMVFRIFGFGVIGLTQMDDDTENWDITLVYMTDRTSSISLVTVLDYADAASDAVAFLGSAAGNTAAGVESSEGSGNVRTDSSVDIARFTMKFTGAAGASTHADEAHIWVEYALIPDSSYFDASP